MNFGPLTWLLIVAPTAVLAALIFIWLYQDNRAVVDLERDRHRVQQMEFDRDFSQAWNGGTLQAQPQAEIDALKAQVQAKEAVQKEAERVNCERVNQLAKELGGQLAADKTPVPC